MKLLIRSLIGFSLAMLVSGMVVIAFTTQPFVTPLPSTPPPVDPQRLRAHVVALSQTFHPRSFDQPKKLNAAADYVRDALRAAVGTKAKVIEQEIIVDGERFRNLVVRFEPKGTPKSTPLLVIGAHYDSHSDSNGGTPGADDNASGVTGIIELARLFAVSPPARSVELVAYTLEEPPHFRSDDMGSARHVQALAREGRKVELMLALEMIGYFSDAPASQRYPVPGMGWLYPTTGNFIGLVSRPQDWQETRALKAAMAGATPLPVYSVNTLPAIPGIDFSDHLSYWAENIPAIMVTNTAFNRNTQYHLAGDTAARLDYARMAQVVQGVYAFARGR